jgi:hypothetical protein
MLPLRAHSDCTIKFDARTTKFSIAWQQRELVLVTPGVNALWSSVSCIHRPELVQWHLFVCFRYDISLFPGGGKV